MAWIDITAAALNGDYDGYIRYANQVLSISGTVTADSTNGLRVFNIKENTHYRVTMVMQNRFRLGCVPTLTTGQTIINYVFSPLDQNDATNQGTFQTLEITSGAGQVFLCVGAWASGAGAAIFDTLGTITLEEQTSLETYTVTFQDWDGSVLKTESVLEGSSAKPPANPSRGGYIFTGWDKPYQSITADTVITAQYHAIGTYVVVFKNYDATTLKTEYVLEGGAATAPTAPAREGYNFSGWDVPFDNVTAELVVTAQFTEKVYHTVTFKDYDGTVLKAQTVEHGTAAAAPEAPSRDEYRFLGWDTSFFIVTTDLTVTAQYAEIIYHTVTFKDWDETVLKTGTVEHGTAATPPTNPSRDGYSFTGWLPADFTKITADLTVTAQYEHIIIYHGIYFYDNNVDYNYYGECRVEDGQPAVPPLPPAKDGFIFDHWDKDLTCVIADMEVFAVFRAALEHTVIRIYSATGTLLQTMDKVLSANLRDSLDGELTFEFSTLAERGEYLGTGCIAEFEGDYFNVVRVTKSISSGLMVTAAACEHISYVLNDDRYKISSFDFTGNPTAGLYQLLSGTQFEPGEVEFESQVTMKINQETTRRAALMQFIAILGGEIQYDGHFIHIRKHRGSPATKQLLDSKNVTDVSVTYDSRASAASYEVAFHKIADCAVGDEVHIQFSPLGVNTDTRIIAMEYNPFYRYSIRVEVGNYKPTINDSLYRIEKTAADNSDDMSAIWDQFDRFDSDYGDFQTDYDSFLSTYREVQNISVGETQFTVSYTDGSMETYNYSVDTTGRMTSITRVVG